MLKKILVSISVILATFFTISTLTPTNTSAATINFVDSNCQTFLGLTSWNCGVNITNSQESVISGVWLIAANIFTDITVISAYLIVGYVIYGGYLYITSGGEPNKVAAGKKTLSQAFIGLAIVMLTSVILNTIRIVLLGAGGSFAEDCIRTQSCTDPTEMVTNVIQWTIGVAGLVSAVFVVLGGISYITSSGDSTKLQKAKNIIIYALIGLVIVALAEIITAFVSNMIRDASNSGGTTTSLINHTISKEVYET